MHSAHITMACNTITINCLQTMDQVHKGKSNNNTGTIREQQGTPKILGWNIVVLDGGVQRRIYKSTHPIMPLPCVQASEAHEVHRNPFVAASIASRDHKSRGTSPRVLFARWNGRIACTKASSKAGCRNSERERGITSARPRCPTVSLTVPEW